MSGPIPQWAKERACELANAESLSVAGRIWGMTDTAVVAFARYIAAHEEPPVDPLVEEAQRIADFNRINLSAQPRVEDALLRALRRGMELARATAPAGDAS